MVADKLTSTTKSHRQMCIRERRVTPKRVKIGDACILLVSLLICAADTIGGVLLGLSYFAAGHMLPGIVTSFLVFIPTIVIQLLSAKFYLEDGMHCRSPTDILHLLICQPYARYVQALLIWYQNYHHDSSPETSTKFINCKNDVHLLRFLQAMMQSAPQLTYQIYLLHAQAKFSFFTGIVACLCLLGVGWAVAALASVRHKDSMGSCIQRHVWPSVLLQALIWMCVVFSRSVSIASFASVHGLWAAAVIGCHWVAMTLWIAFQESEICSSRVGKILFSCVLGVVYCFGFKNLEASRTRVRITVFYLLCLLENAAMMLVWYSADTRLISWRVALLCTVLVVFLLGILCTIVYHQFFHSPANTASNLVISDLDTQLPRNAAGFQSGRSFCVAPSRTLKCRQSNTRLELYTPSRLSPVLHRVMPAVEDNSTLGDVTYLDTSGTSSLHLDQFHHYSINASDCLTPMVTVRRRNEMSLRPFSVVDSEGDLECDDRIQVAAGLPTDGDSSVVKVSDETTIVRPRFSGSLPPSVIEDSEEAGQQRERSSLEIDDCLEVSLSEQLEGKLAS